jgi:5'-3' exoribonuclease 1
VAPKAKMNQQRNRRFKSGKSKSKFSNELIKCGIPKSEETFINNSITPGTKFMTELNKIMKFYVHKKLKEDYKWRHVI